MIKQHTTPISSIYSISAHGMVVADGRQILSSMDKHFAVSCFVVVVLAVSASDDELRAVWMTRRATGMMVSMPVVVTIGMMSWMVIVSVAHRFSECEDIEQVLSDRPVVVV